MNTYDDFIKSFNKDITLCIKGFAIVVMLIHHFFGFPGWHYNGVDYSGMTVLGWNLDYWLCAPTKMAVAIFAFLTGVGYYYAKQKTIKYSLNRICKVMLNYWIILLGIFLPWCIMAGTFIPKVSSIVLNMLAVDANRLIRFSWYIAFFYMTMLFLPLWKRLLSGKFLFDVSLVVLCCYLLNDLLRYIVCPYPIIIYVLSEFFLWFPLVAIGYLMMQHKIFKKIYDLIYCDNLLMSLIVVIIIFCCRFHCERIGFLIMDYVYTPFLVFELVIIFNKCGKYIFALFRFLGLHSLNYWLLHAAFFNIYSLVLHKLAYLPYYPPLVIIWVILLMTPVSLIINFIMKPINGIINTLLK